MDVVLKKHMLKKNVKWKILNTLDKLLADLTGQTAPFAFCLPSQSVELLRREIGLGYSQLNELLLLKGYDRISPEFFQYIVDGTIDFQESSEI